MKHSTAFALSHLELFESISAPLLAGHRRRQRSAGLETRVRLAGNAAPKVDKSIAEMSDRCSQLRALALDPNPDVSECAAADLFHETAPASRGAADGKVMGGKLIASIQALSAWESL